MRDSRALELGALECTDVIRCHHGATTAVAACTSCSGWASASVQRACPWQQSTALPVLLLIYRLGIGDGVSQPSCETDGDAENSGYPPRQFKLCCLLDTSQSEHGTSTEYWALCMHDL